MNVTDSGGKSFEVMLALVGVVLGAVLAVLSAGLIVSWILVGLPMGLEGAVEQSRQKATIVKMRHIADANRMYYVDQGRYATNLRELDPQYLSELPMTDGWGNPWHYRGGRQLTLVSLGADGMNGPEAPSPWVADFYETDLVLENGSFIQAPGQ